MIKLPEDFIADMKTILKDEYDEFLASYDLPNYKGLRLNTLKIQDASILPFKTSKIPWCETGYYYEEDGPGKHVYHDMGLYYIQEPSAMAVVEELDVCPGEICLDLCAAPGGKSTQIAAKLNGSGVLVSNEIIPSRAKILSQNIERMGITNAVVTNESPKNIAKFFPRKFDKILVDAPCSGEGMFRKNEEAINEWSEENVQMCADRQLEILIEAEKCLKENGRIVYSTCTFSIQENEGLIKRFLDLYPSFHLIQPKHHFENGLLGMDFAQRIYPHKVKGEGHFFAVLQRDGEEAETTFKMKEIKQNTMFDNFILESTVVDLKYNVVFGDNLYLSPIQKLDGLRVERPGLHLGEIKKNRFEPSHSLALALKPQDFKNKIELKADSKELQAYLSGETIETDIVGWGVIVVDGHNLGLFKGDGRIAKNHYPKGLRK